MKITQVLYKQNIGRLIKWQWRAQRKKTLIETNAEKVLAARNIPIIDSKQFLKEPIFEAQKQDIQQLLDNVIGPVKLQPKLNNAHPLWNYDPCYVYGDHNVLVRGLDQAKVFTNSIEPESGLPKYFKDLYEAYRLPNQDEHVQRIITASLLYDAVQEKLPIKKDPKRPAWKFPRDYGIPDSRRNNLIVSRLLQLCESSVGSMSSNKLIAKDVYFKVPLQRNGNISLNVRADLLLLSDSYLAPYVDEIQGELPDIYPLDYKVSLEEINIYHKDEFISPLSGKFNNIHTAFIYYNETEVKNLYETPVLQSQIFGRSLMKSYAFAVANAKSKYGENVKELSEPITLQCVHTNSQWFHFSVFQLNSLAGPEENGKKNIYWQAPLFNLFEECVYEDGVPILKDYNQEVFKNLLSFYMNGTEYELK
ncbi:39S ribosomal protein L37, mitochondrial [Sipha flava]|jgi:large subunit ribosomal protein L37|uniref:Large ribosomal subunit protein mL37 n=1 Tax=Sipha flava TaxID=143950 RepID=A0A2S2QT70_9HEMI|nr:39S ribosomal protein L37, mitochondrial [Sipha flava]